MLMSNVNDKKPLASTTTGGFNARSKTWWSQYISNSQGSIIGTFTSTSGYHQLINSPTHMTNTNSSCINLIFTSNASLITEFGIEKFLYADSCYHSIVFWLDESQRSFLGKSSFLCSKRIGFPSAPFLNIY